MAHALAWHIATKLPPEQNCASILSEARPPTKIRTSGLPSNKLQDTGNLRLQERAVEGTAGATEHIFNAIDEQRKEAERNAQQLAKESAQSNRFRCGNPRALRQAQAALDSLKIVLYNLDNANADKVRLILAEVARSQKELNFDAAVDKIKTARILRALPDSVDLAYKKLSRLLLAHAIQRYSGQSLSRRLKIQKCRRIERTAGFRSNSRTGCNASCLKTWTSILKTVITIRH
ncbi:MAG: hypothetical protein IPL27_26590 [Lewinellaceae bacterium]|nr:hypothetical protein [Lewinellaceae bacterium]